MPRPPSTSYSYNNVLAQKQHLEDGTEILFHIQNLWCVPSSSSAPPIPPPRKKQKDSVQIGTPSSLNSVIWYFSGCAFHPKPTKQKTHSPGVIDFSLQETYQNKFLALN